VQRLFAEVFQGNWKAKPEDARDMIVANSVEKGPIILVKMPDFGIPSLITGG